MQKNLSLTQGQLGLFVYVVVVAVFVTSEIFCVVMVSIMKPRFSSLKTKEPMVLMAAD